WWGAEREPEWRRMRALTAQFITEKEIVQRYQHDPVRQTDNANEENPRQHAGEEIFHCASRFRLRFAQRARYECGNDCDEGGQSIEPVIEHAERSRPAEAVDAHNGNHIAREHDPRVGLRRELTQMLRERRRRDRSQCGRAGFFRRVRHRETLNTGQRLGINLLRAERENFSLSARQQKKATPMASRSSQTATMK